MIRGGRSDDSTDGMNGAGGKEVLASLESLAVGANKQHKV